MPNVNQGGDLTGLIYKSYLGSDLEGKILAGGLGLYCSFTPTFA
jgi:hypothetical protein